MTQADARRRVIGQHPSEGRDLAFALPGKTLYAEHLAVGDYMDLGSVAVSREEIICFAKRFDPLPIHVDGTDSLFGDVIASGMHTLSLFASMASPKFMARLALVAGKGFEQMRLPHPVLPDDVLSASLEVVEVRMGPRRADVYCRYEMAEQDGNLVMTMVGIQVVNRRFPLA